MIQVLLPALERHGRLELKDELRLKPSTVSPATIDRHLTEGRIVAHGGQRGRAGMSSAVRRSVPVRTFGDWNDPPPGFVEVDFLAHALRGEDKGMAEEIQRAATPVRDRSGSLHGKEAENDATPCEGMAHKNGWDNHSQRRVEKEPAPVSPSTIMPGTSTLSTPRRSATSAREAIGGNCACTARQDP
ncbi:hypothetical protein [Rhizobium sophoriradicis]|uniref:hypothetical protein n=1 Tax=Rhizobium sophoriradicis TaxID=1535245 RepID=UPI001FE0A0C8|nr:hypothetical protein [Rhizobium sophoriradicis]